MRVPCALISRARRITLEHRPGTPAREAHEVALIPSRSEPLMGIGVTQLVGVDRTDARLPRTPVDHLGASRIGETALVAESQPR